MKSADGPLANRHERIFKEFELMTSLRDCINEKCKSCIYDPFTAGGWKEQVTVCSSANCPLHPVRPISDSCRRDGYPDPKAINALAELLDQRDRERSKR